MLLYLFYYFIFSTIFISAKRLEKYVAVVEYQSIRKSGLTPSEVQNLNAGEYLKLIDKLTSDHNLTMIIFPEGTLDNVEKEKDLKSLSVNLRKSSIPNPCLMEKDFPQFLQKLSCAAARYNIFIVINLIEEVESEYYTSDVFNPGGFIQMSFRREDRIGASFLRHSPIPFVVPSKTNFYVLEDEERIEGTKYNPTSIVTGFRFSPDKAIGYIYYSKNYIICSNWISQLPFLTSLQVYQMWAREYKMSVFFSGANNPKKGLGGTGIITYEGPVVMHIQPKGGTRAFVYNFLTEYVIGEVFPPVEDKTVDTLAKEMDSFFLEKDPDFSKYNSTVLDVEKPQIHQKLCYETNNDTFCCNFDIKMSYDKRLKKSKQYTYHLVAYRGPKTYYKIMNPGGVEICALVACLNSSITSCGQRFKDYNKIKWPTTFEEIVVSAIFAAPRKEKIYYSTQFPNSLLSSIRPIHPNRTQWYGEKLSDDEHKRIFELIEPESKILTFGIFGRNFTLPNPEDLPSAATKCKTPEHFVLALFLGFFLISFRL